MDENGDISEPVRNAVRPIVAVAGQRGWKFHFGRGQVHPDQVNYRATSPSGQALTGHCAEDRLEEVVQPLIEKNQLETL